MRSLFVLGAGVWACSLLLICGCASMGGALIGGVTDIATSDTESLSVMNIKTLEWKVSLELILKDSRTIQGDYEGFAAGDSGKSNSPAILPARNEIVDIYDSSGVHRNYLFKAFYYQSLNHAIIPMLRLGTTADDLSKPLSECPVIIRADGDTIRPETILREFGRTTPENLSVVISNPVAVLNVPYGSIAEATIVRKKKGLVTGLTYGAFIDIAYWTIVLLSLRGSDFSD